jgi:biopolymer transport protein ExbB
MAENKPTATSTVARSAASAQPKRGGNAISWIAPLACIVAGFLIWRLVMGAAYRFDDAAQHNQNAFWPDYEKPKKGDPLANMFLGGIVVPLLLGTFLLVVTMVIERFLTILKAGGKMNNNEFIRKVQFHLANKNVDAALAECDKQKGSVGNVMKSGLKTYKAMINNTELSTEQKVLTIQKEVEEATALELPMLEKNLVFLSTISSVATLLGLFGTVLGMIRSFSALATEGGANAAQKLSIGISEALYNTALGIGTSAVAIIFYNIFTTRIDGITYGIDESMMTLTQSFAANYK